MTFISNILVSLGIQMNKVGLAVPHPDVEGLDS